MSFNTFLILYNITNVLHSAYNLNYVDINCNVGGKLAMVFCNSMSVLLCFVNLKILMTVVSLSPGEESYFTAI